jgi:GNAT superfamily N-acetyltransferase
MVDLDKLKLVKLNKNGVKTLIIWAKNEGWNPGEFDFDVYWKTDSNGFYGFYLENRLIAGGSVISYNNTFGFMGLFIVHPDFRGYGIGNKLWHLRKNILVKRLNKNAPIGMDGVLTMQNFYEKGGFKIAFRDERYEFTGQNYITNKNISEIIINDHNKIFNYDLHCFGFNRFSFLKEWLLIPNSKSFKFLKNNKIMGYAVIRKVNNGYKIGPLFANEENIAEDLFKACLNSALGEKIYLDIPVVNNEALRMVKQYQGKYVFECARMYYGLAPKIPLAKIYGITTFELG